MEAIVQHLDISTARFYGRLFNQARDLAYWLACQSRMFWTWSRNADSPTTGRRLEPVKGPKSRNIAKLLSALRM
jgi:hypothetical protein